MMIRRFTINNVNDTKLITFYIDNKEYQYEKGMTWEEWINSQYNTDNFVFYGNVIKNNGYRCDGLYVYTNGRHIYVEGTDYIDEKNTYKFFYGGAGD
jgi:hypothetical protein